MITLYKRNAQGKPIKWSIYKGYGNYINVEYIKYIYILPITDRITYRVSIGDNKEIEISKDTYNYLISNYYE